MKPKFKNEKCTAEDCRALFGSSREELRWLCYTLTGDGELSDKAMDAALQQSLKGAGQVFRGWMLNWARRLLVKFCIATVRPSEGPLTQSAYPLFPGNVGEVNTHDVRDLLSLPAGTLQQIVMRLDAFSRFVFVLRALEGYTRRDTALLLNIDDRACEWVYGWATSRLITDAGRRMNEEFEVLSMPVLAEFPGQSVSFQFASAI